MPLASVEQFCDIRTPYTPHNEQDFITAMRDIVRWHETQCDWYGAFLKQHAIDSNALTTLEDIIHLPPVHANFFKHHQVTSVAQSDIVTHLTSSGTTGQKSQMFFDAFTMNTARRMVDDCMAARGVISEQPANYLVNAYEPYPGFKVGTSNTNQYLMRYATPEQSFWTLRAIGDGKHEFDVFGALSALQSYAQSSVPTRIIGFPAFLHFTIERMQHMQLAPLKLPPDSWVMFGGGWKGHADKAISRPELADKITHWLGIDKDHIVETFGAVEHCIPYVGCTQQHLHVPTWSKVVIRDVKTLQPLDYGQTGFLSFISPYITSVPAHSVVMGDLAVLHPPGSCTCGNHTAWFDVLGRAGTSANKSCAAAASELLSRS
jgi:phenylacetate-coenzyme A ligase PaaK-like adenylate-forming protein